MKILKRLKLEEIEGLHHSLHADDIALWVTEGNDGYIEHTLQAVVDAVQTYLRATRASNAPPLSRSS